VSTNDEQVVRPGAYSADSFPVPSEVVCINVVKVFDACSQRECIEVLFDLTEIPDEIVECEIVDIDIECNLRQVQDEPPLVRANVTLMFTVQVTFKIDGFERVVRKRITRTKSVLLFGTNEMFCKVERVIRCLGCDITPQGDIFCEVGIFLVIKTAADVQLLIPAFGFCPVPPECQELPTRCEEFLEGPPPPLFPPQPEDFNNNNC